MLKPDKKIIDIHPATISTDCPKSGCKTNKVTISKSNKKDIKYETFKFFIKFVLIIKQ